MIQQTLVCICNGRGEILFGVKGRKIGQGRRMWPGGNKEAHHLTLADCATAEVLEETGLTVYNLKALGRLDCVTESGFPMTRQVYIFATCDYEGDLVATDELGDPQWFPADALPWSNMWPSDQYWIPTVLSGNTVYMRLTYGATGSLLRYGNLPG